MSAFIDCIRRNIPKSMAEALTKQHADIMKAQGIDSVAADIILEQVVRERAGTQAAAKMRQIIMNTDTHRAVKAELARQQEYYDGLNKGAKWAHRKLSKLGEPNEAGAIRVLFQSADDFAKGVSMEYLARLPGIAERIAPNTWSRFRSDSKSMADVVRVVMGGKIDDAELTKAGKELAAVFKLAVDDLRSTGALMGDLENYTPIQHTADKMRAADYETWRVAYRKMNDLDQIIDDTTGVAVSEERFAEISRNIYDDVLSNGATAAERSMAGGGSTRDPKGRRKSGAALYMRRANSRFSRPISAEAYLEYNKAFGVGDAGLYDMLIGSIAKLGHDVGMMQKLGPDPYSFYSGAMNRLDTQGAKATDMARTGAEFRTLMSDWEGTADSLMSSTIKTLQQLQSASLLGSAAVSALGDVVVATIASRIHGMSGADAFVNFFKGMSVGDHTRGYRIAEALSNTAIGRVMDDSAAGAHSLMHDVNAKVMKISGLHELTMITADAAVLTNAGELGRYMKTAGLSLADIAKDNPSYAKLLATHGITDADLKAAQLHGVDKDGMFSRNLMLSTAELEFSKTPKPLKGAVPLEIAAYRDASMRLHAARKAARAFGSVEVAMRMRFTNSPDLHIRAWSSGRRLGATVEGGAGNLVSSSVMQFKSFPMSLWYNVIVPTLVEALEGRMSNLAMLGVGAMGMGALIVQAKQAIKGQSGYETEDPELWRKAFIQSGMGYLAGDFLFGGHENFGSSFTQALIGPTASNIDKTARVTVNGILAMASGDADEQTTAARNAINNVARNTPGATLWYGKTAFQHYVVDTLQQLADPGYKRILQSRERQRKTEHNIEQVWGGAGML